MAEFTEKNQEKLLSIDEIKEELQKKYPNKDEGFLTRLRAKLVNGKALAVCAEAINLGSLILMSKNNKNAGI